MAVNPYVLKNTDNVDIHPQENAGAHYYVFTGTLSTEQYSSATANIVLPSELSVRGSAGEKRNAYIALGVAGSYIGAHDWLYSSGLDLCLCSQDGITWHPAYMDTYDKAQEQIVSETAPSETTNAIFTITPVNDQVVDWYIDFLAGTRVVKKFYKRITVTKARTWDKYYRFASLVPDPTGAPDHREDGTKMVGGKFKNLNLLSPRGQGTDWGILPNDSSALVKLAYTVYHPRCQVSNMTEDGESFIIGHYVG